MFGVSGGGRTSGILTPVGLEEEDEVITVLVAVAVAVDKDVTAFALIVVQLALAELALETPLFIDGAEPGARAGP